MYTPFNTLFGAFLDICRFKLGPQDIPASSFLLGLTLVAYTLFSAGFALVQMPVGPALLAGVVNSTMMVGCTLVALQFRGVPERLNQTVTSLAGAGIIVSLIALPIIIWLDAAEENQEEAFVPALLWLCLFFWDLLITAHILRHALSIRFTVGVLVALIYTWLLYSVINASVPVSLTS